jgi:hypothetical protein
MKATYTIKFRKWKDGGTRDEHEFVDMKGVMVAHWGGPWSPTPLEACHFGDCEAAINQITHHVSPGGYDLHIGLRGFDFGSDSEGFDERVALWRKAGFDVST